MARAETSLNSELKAQAQATLWGRLFCASHYFKIKLSGHQIQFIHLGAAKLTDMPMVYSYCDFGGAYLQAPSQKLCSLQYGYGKLLK